MAKFKPLTHEETMELIIASQGGSEEAREVLVDKNTRLVWSVVQRFINRGYDPDDLFQIGAIGLLKGIDKFDTSYGVKFSTYSVPMIIGEIQRFIRDDGIIKVSRSIKEIVAKMRKHDLIGKTPEEIMEVLDIDNIDQVKTAIQYIKKGNVRSIDETIYENEGDPITIQDQLPGDVNGEWLDSMALRSAFEKLTDRERKIVELRYYKDRTQTEVSDELGVSQVQVSRLEKKILEKMRGLMKEEEEMPYQQPKGDRQMAIKLLSQTSLTHKQISEETGVPVGTLGVMAKEWRDSEVSAKNRRKFNEGKAAAEKQRGVTKKVKREKQTPVETPVINEPAFMGEKDLVKKQSQAQIVEVEGEDIVVRNSNEEEVYRINSAGTKTGRLDSSVSHTSQVPKSAAVIVADMETAPVEVVGPSLTFSTWMNLKGEQISKDQALDSLVRAIDMVKLMPDEPINLSLSLKNL